MTINDLCPGMDQLSPERQALELCTRALGDIRLALLSGHLIAVDRDHLHKALKRLELQQTTLIRILDGREDTDSHKQPPVPSPAGTPARPSFGADRPSPEAA